MLRSRTLSRVTLLTIAASAVIGCLTSGPLAQARAVPSAATPAWRVVATAPGILDTVIAPAGTSAWALGWRGGNVPIKPVGRHWNGAKWSPATFPAGVTDSGIACAASSSAANTWAFSGAGSSLGNPPASSAALRYSAGRGRWVIQKKFPPGYVTGCLVFSPTDVWVFGGGTGLGPGVGTWHLHGTTWTAMNTGSCPLQRASASSPADIWAIDNYGCGQPAVYRWNGRTWAQNTALTSKLPRPGKNGFVSLGAVTALSASNVWVEAIVSKPKNVVQFSVLHWNGRTWTAVRPADPGYHLPGAVADGHGGWWSAGYSFQASKHPFFLHFASGRWTRVRVSVPAGTALFPGFAVGPPFASIPGTRSMLAISTVTNGPSSSSGVVLAYGPLP